MLDINEILEKFKKNTFVLKALQNPRSPRSILNYMCSGDTNDPAVKKSLNNVKFVSSLLVIWFQSGQSLDKLCQPFIPIVRELKSKPQTLIGDEWGSIDGKIAKVLLADQLSRSCFRGEPEAFAYDEIARDLVHELFNEKNRNETLKKPAAILYLLPWALAHSENIKDLESALSIIELTAKAYPEFILFEGRNKQAVYQHHQVLEKFGRYPQRNNALGRKSTIQEKKWLDNKENLPIWAGGKLPIDQDIN